MGRCQLTFLCAALLALAACSAPVDSPTAAAGVEATSAKMPRARNVILVTIDTLRADFLGAYGGPARTPILDGLATDGWLFEECFAAAMLTNPSHASLMTSLYPRDHGVYDNESGIEDGMGTLATRLKRHGMQTGAVIGFPHLNPSVSNLGQGFTHVTKATRRERRAPETSRAALEMVDRLTQDADAASAGFFVWVHYVDPHAPYEPPSTHPPRPAPGSDAQRTPMQRAAQAAPGFQRKHPWFKAAFRKYRNAEALVQRYVAEIEATDTGLGLLLDGLRDRRLADTAIVVTSDHGENMGEHDLFFHHGGLFRHAVHVPLLISAPGTTKVRFAQQVATVDIAPTILEMVGAAPWEPMRGHSLFGLARGTDPGREFVFSEHMNAQLVAARSTEGLLVFHRKSSRQFPTYPFESGKRELFDLAHDPHENTSQPATGDLAHRLESAIQRYLGLGLQLSARQPVGQDRESLRALGYIE